MKDATYCYHLVNAITFLLSQSDLIKRLSLYLEGWKNAESYFVIIKCLTKLNTLIVRL